MKDSMENNEQQVFIDPEENVFIGDKLIGRGEVTLHEALEKLQISQLDSIRIIDERNTEEAAVWDFYPPYEFESLLEALEETPPTSTYVPDPHLSPTDYDPESDSGGKIMFDWDQMGEEQEDSVPEHEESDTDDDLDPEALQEDSVPVETDSLDLFYEQTPEDLKPKLPDNVEDLYIDVGELRRDQYADHYEPNRSNQGDEEQLLYPLKDQTYVMREVGVDTTSAQVYEPGERVTNVPLSVKRNPIEEHRIVSKKPLWGLCILGGLVLIGFLIRWISLPDPQVWEAVCFDERTELVAETEICTNDDEPPLFYNIGYVHQEDANELSTLDQLPDNYQTDTPSGNVEVQEISEGE